MMNSPWISSTITRLRASRTNAVALVVVVTLAIIATTQIHTVRQNSSSSNNNKDRLTEDWNQKKMPWVFATDPINNNNDEDDDFIISTNTTTTTKTTNNKDKDLKLLFIGNSYTEFNDLASLTQQVFREPWNARVLVKSHTPGGETFRGHYAATLPDYHPPPGTAKAWIPMYMELRKWLVTQPKSCHWVLLQEQSQIPGFWDVPGIPHDQSFNASLHGVGQLNRLAARLPTGGGDGGEEEQKFAQTMFYMSWGRRNGDDYNPGLYPDYLTMQTRLVQGYRKYCEATSKKGRPTYIAPVGLVFQTIFEQCQKRKTYQNTKDDNPGTDPYSLFYQLYHYDGSHPSPLGSYAAALTIYASIMGNDPRDIHWAPSELSSVQALQIRQAVAKTILDTASNGWMHYPWQEEEGLLVDDDGQDVLNTIDDDDDDDLDTFDIIDDDADQGDFDSDDDPV